MDHRPVAATPAPSLSPNPANPRSSRSPGLHSSWRRSVLRSAEGDLRDRGRVELSLSARRQRRRTEAGDAGNAAPTRSDIVVVAAVGEAVSFPTMAPANRAGSD